MKKNIILVVSIAINLLLISAMSIYMFSPLLDMAIIQKTLPRFCAFVEKNNPVAYKDVTLCHIDEQPTTPTPIVNQPVNNKLNKINNTEAIPADWKTYSNNALGFLVSYPSSWKITELTSDNSFREGIAFNEKEADPANTYAQLAVFYHADISEVSYTNKEPKTLDEYMNDPMFKDAKEVSFNGERAFSATNVNNNADIAKTEIFIQHQGHIYEITYFDADKDITTINAVIKTFKFIDTPSNKTQPLSTKETLNCGKEYLSDIVFIDNIEVIKKIIDLKTVNGKCELNIAGDNIGISEKVDASKKIYTVVLYDKDNKQQSADPYNQSTEIFQIDLNSNTVSFQNQLDGSFTKIGNWK